MKFNYFLYLANYQKKEKHKLHYERLNEKQYRQDSKQHLVLDSIHIRHCWAVDNKSDYLDMYKLYLGR